MLRNCAHLPRRLLTHRNGSQVRHIDFTTTKFKLNVFAKLPRKAAAKAAGLAVTGGNPDGPTATVVADPDQFGYGKLYVLILEHSKPSVARAIRLLAEEQCYPMMAFCVHGCASVACSAVPVVRCRCFSRSVNHSKPARFRVAQAPLARTFMHAGWASAAAHNLAEGVGTQLLP